MTRIRNALGAWLAGIAGMVLPSDRSLVVVPTGAAVLSLHPDTGICRTERLAEASQGSDLERQTSSLTTNMIAGAVFRCLTSTNLGMSLRDGVYDTARALGMSDLEATRLINEPSPPRTGEPA